MHDGAVGKPEDAEDRANVSLRTAGKFFIRRREAPSIPLRHRHTEEGKVGHPAVRAH